MLSLIYSLYPQILKVDYIKKVFLEITQALSYLHKEKNIAHNDIKLENIFIFPNK